MMKVTDFKVGNPVILNYIGERMFCMPSGTMGIVTGILEDFVRVDFEGVDEKYCLPDEIDLCKPSCEPREVDWV